MMRLTTIVIAVALASVLAAVAFSASPESGTLSAAERKIEWTGETTGAGFVRLAVVQTGDASVPCRPPTCDSFALELADSANLTIGADIGRTTADNPGTVTFRIRKPDESIQVSSSGTGDVYEDKPYKLTIKSAPVGNYTVEYWSSVVDITTYKAFAELTFPQPQPAEETATATPTAEPTATPTGTPTATPSATPPPELSLTVRAGKASARRANRSRKLSASVTVSREVVAVTATLKRERIVLGRGALGAVKGSARLTVKLSRRLRPGVQRLTVVARDSGGRTATRTAALKVAT